MIVGNPKSGRTMAACGLVLIILLAITTALVATRKKTPPTNVAPLHPSTIVLTAW